MGMKVVQLSYIQYNLDYPNILGTIIPDSVRMSELVRVTEIDIGQNSTRFSKKEYSVLTKV